MPDDELGERTMAAAQEPLDPNDCATMVTREVHMEKERTPQRTLERRIKTIDRIIQSIRRESK